MPSYRRWATDIVRFGLKPEPRLASCWSVEVVNGAAGDRFWVRVPSLVTTGWSSRMAAACASEVASSGMSSASPSIRTSSAAKVSPAAVARIAWIVQYSRAVKAADLALALDDEPDRDRLHATGRQATLDLLAEERAQRVADEAVDDAARLLGVDEVHVDLARVARTPRGSPTR